MSEKHELPPYEPGTPQYEIGKLLDTGRFHEAVELFKEHRQDRFVIGFFNADLTGFAVRDPEGRNMLLTIAKDIIYTAEPAAYNLTSSMGMIALAAVLENDQEMIKQIVWFCSDPLSPRSCGYANNIGKYAYALLLGNDFPSSRRLFEMALDIITAPSCTDISVFGNAPVALMRGVTGLPVNRELNEKFICKCRPHAPECPDIYYSIACLYVEMDDFDRAVEYVELALKHDHKNYDSMIERLKTCSTFKEFRKDPRVRKILARLTNRSDAT